MTIKDAVIFTASFFNAKKHTKNPDLIIFLSANIKFCNKN